MPSDASAIDNGEVLLRGELNVNHVLGIRETLLRAIEAHQVTQVRLQGVVDIDAAFLQLLCSAHRSAVDAGRELRLQVEASPLFPQQLRECGFIRHIGCRLDCNGSCLWVAAGALGGA